LPENGYGANVTEWPARLQALPDRLQSIQLNVFSSRTELFKAESTYWKAIIASYVRALHWKKIRLRNIMDMRAGFGGYCFSYLLSCYKFAFVTFPYENLQYICVLQICSSID